MNPARSIARRWISLIILLALASPATSQPQNRRQAQLSWWDRSREQKVGYYWIKTDLPGEEVKGLATHLNLMYEEYAKRLASLPVRADEKLNVLIFKEQQDYLLTLRARFGVNGTGSGGMFFVTAQGSGLAFWTEDLPLRRVHHVIQHEGFHQFAYSRFGNDLPIWVNEGLAEFFGESIVVDRKLVMGQSNPRVLDSVKQAIELQKHIPFQQMLTMTPQTWGQALHDGSAALQYNQAWSMVHFLVYGDSGKYVGAFEKYLRHLNAGLPSEEAFVRSFGPDIQSFEDRWKLYASAARPSSFLSAMERIEFLAEGALELSRKRIYPETLDSLRTELRTIGFAYKHAQHGVQVTLSAADDSLFVIPQDDLCAEQPQFVVAKAELGRMSLKQKKLEEANPTPPSISTDKLRPKGIRVNWLRDEDANTWRFEIDLK